MMKEKYTSPELEIITFRTQDIITESVPCNGDTTTGGGGQLPIVGP